MQDRLRAALRSNISRVATLFADWDDDGSGLISRREFRMVLPALGLDVAKSEAKPPPADLKEAAIQSTVSFLDSIIVTKELQGKVVPTKAPATKAPRLKREKSPDKTAKDVTNIAILLAIPVSTLGSLYYFFADRF